MRPFVLALFILAVATPAAAQRELWTVASNTIVVYDLDSGAEIHRIPLPLRAFNGRMSFDRGSYLVDTEWEVGQIDVLTRRLVRRIPKPTELNLSAIAWHSGLWSAQSEKYWFFWWSTPHGQTSLEVVDAITQRTLWTSARSTLFAVDFDASGERAYLSYRGSMSHSDIPPTQSALSAREARTGAELWRHVWNGVVLDCVESEQGVYVLGYDSPYQPTTLILTRLDRATGQPLVSHEMPLGSLNRSSLYGTGKDRLATFDNDVYVLSVGRLDRFDGLTLDLTAFVESTGYQGRGWLFFDTANRTGYVVNASTGVVYSFEPESLRQIRGVVLPSVESAGFGELRVPRPPRLTAFAADRRVELRWQPDATGATPLTFEIRAGVRGSSLRTVALVDGALRTWSSADVPPGSYDVEVVARNRVGAGLPSTRATVGIDHAVAAEAPEWVAADVTDDTVRLLWRAANQGITPQSYVMEAAPAGASTYALISQSDVPEFHAVGVPPGTWSTRVRGVTSAGVSAPSSALEITARRCTTAPREPRQVAFVVTAPTVTLQWQEPESGMPSEYVLEVGSEFGTANLLRTSLIGTTSFVQVVAPPGSYAVRLRARNICGESAPSGEVVVLVPPPVAGSDR